MRITRPKLQVVESPAFSRGKSVNAFAWMGAICAIAFAICMTTFETSQAQNLSTTQQTGIFIAGVDTVLINQRPAQPGQVVRMGDTIQTDASGRARFAFMGSTTLHLAGNTEVRIDRIVAPTSGRPATLIFDMNRGMGRVISGSPSLREAALVRGGGSLAAIQSGVLDMVSSNDRLVTAMRSGAASCRASSGQVVAMTTSQRACILVNGGVRPSAMSAGMARAIDDRLSVPPSAQARAVPNIGIHGNTRLNDRLSASLGSQSNQQSASASILTDGSSTAVTANGTSATVSLGGNGTFTTTTTIVQSGPPVAVPDQPQIQQATGPSQSNTASAFVTTQPIDVTISNGDNGVSANINFSSFSSQPNAGQATFSGTIFGLQPAASDPN